MTLTFEQLPYVYQIEALAHAVWWAETGIQTSPQQLEDDVKQEALKIWQTATRNQENVNNITRNFAPNNRRNVTAVLDRLLNYRKNSLSGSPRFGDGTDDNYRRQNGKWIPLMNKVYQEQVDKNQQLQQTINNLNQQVTDSNNTNTQLQQANQALQTQVQALQKKVDELNALIDGGPGEETADRAVMMRSKTQLEAKVGQPTNLPPK